MKRSLVLRREALAELTPADLVVVGAGQIPPPTPVGPSSIIDDIQKVFPWTYGLPVQCLSGCPCV